METDLLRQQPKWKEILKEIRSIMHQLDQQGFSDQKSWATHWDRQLYKALEHQYQLGVEALNQHLPEIKVELTYRLTSKVNEIRRPNNVDFFSSDNSVCNSIPQSKKSE